MEKFKNLEQILRKKLNFWYEDTLSLFKKDIEEQECTNGVVERLNAFEIAKHYTKSGRTESIKYNVVLNPDFNGESDDEDYVLSREFLYCGGKRAGAGRKKGVRIKPPTIIVNWRVTPEEKVYLADCLKKYREREIE